MNGFASPRLITLLQQRSLCLVSAPMSLREEIRQTKPFASPAAEAYLALLRTSDLLLRDFEELFKRHGLTEPRYNALRILRGAGAVGLPAVTEAERGEIILEDHSSRDRCREERPREASEEAGVGVTTTCRTCKARWMGFHVEGKNMHRRRCMSMPEHSRPARSDPRKQAAKVTRRTRGKARRQGRPPRLGGYP